MTDAFPQNVFAPLVEPIAAAEGAVTAPTIWLDISGPPAVANTDTRPGDARWIAREMVAALPRRVCPTYCVRFVTPRRDGGGFEIAPLPAIAAAGPRTGEAPPASAARTFARQPEAAAAGVQTRGGKGGLRALARGLAYRLPVDIRQPLLTAFAEQREAARAIRAAIATAASEARRGGGRLTRRPAATNQKSTWERLSDHARQDDVIVTFADRCGDRGALAAVTQARALGLRHALFIDDIVAAFRPEWFPPGHSTRFAGDLAAMLARSDICLASSHACASEIERFAAGCGIEARDAVVVPPFIQPRRDIARDNGGEENYVLCLSPIEPRRNHALPLHVWRRLLDDLGPARVPRLVLAGQAGWLVEDFMAQLGNCHFLDGHIARVTHFGDADLAALHRGSLFTVCPSFHEGWGFPLAASLAFGRPCIAADTPSSREAGGGFARYFPSGDATGAYAVIRHAIEHPSEVRSWADDIARNYKPTTAEDAARALIEALRLEPLAAA